MPAKAPQPADGGGGGGRDAAADSAASRLCGRPQRPQPVPDDSQEQEPRQAPQGRNRSAAVQLRVKPERSILNMGLLLVSA